MADDLFETHDPRDDDRTRRTDDDRPRRKNYDDREPPSGAKRGNGMATASVVLGVLSLCGGLTAIPGIVCGIVGLNRSKVRGTGNGASIAGIILSCLFGGIGGIALMIALLLPAVQKVREAAARMNSQNNLKMVGLGMQNFDSAQGGLPPQAIRGKNGKKLLSWRVAILPYIEQDNLYQQFKLDEPWDSPANKKLIPLIPKAYVTAPRPGPEGSGETYLKVFYGDNTAFKDAPPAKGALPFDNAALNRSAWSVAGLLNTPRGTSNLILCVEAGQPVIWTKPDDLEYDPNGLLPDLKPIYASGMMVLKGDGAVVSLRANTPEATIRACIDPTSRQMVPLE